MPGILSHRGGAPVPVSRRRHRNSFFGSRMGTHSPAAIDDSHRTLAEKARLRDVLSYWTFEEDDGGDIAVNRAWTPQFFAAEKNSDPNFQDLISETDATQYTEVSTDPPNTSVTFPEVGKCVLQGAIGQTAGIATISTLLTARPYLVTIVVDEISGGTPLLTIRDGGVAYIYGSISTKGIHQFLIVEAGTSHNLYIHTSGDTYAEVSSVSFREVEDFGNNLLSNWDIGRNSLTGWNTSVGGSSVSDASNGYWDIEVIAPDTQANIQQDMVLGDTFVAGYEVLTETGDEDIRIHFGLGDILDTPEGVGAHITDPKIARGTDPGLRFQLTGGDQGPMEWDNFFAGRVGKGDMLLSGTIYPGVAAFQGRRQNKVGADILGGLSFDDGSDWLLVNTAGDPPTSVDITAGVFTATIGTNGTVGCYYLINLDPGQQYFVEFDYTINLSAGSVTSFNTRDSGSSENITVITNSPANGSYSAAISHTVYKPGQDIYFQINCSAGTTGTVTISNVRMRPYLDVSGVLMEGATSVMDTLGTQYDGLETFTLGLSYYPMEHSSTDIIKKLNEWSVTITSTGLVRIVRARATTSDTVQSIEALAEDKQHNLVIKFVHVDDSTPQTIQAWHNGVFLPLEQISEGNGAVASNTNEITWGGSAATGPIIGIIDEAFIDDAEWSEAWIYDWFNDLQDDVIYEPETVVEMLQRLDGLAGIEARAWDAIYGDEYGDILYEVVDSATQPTDLINGTPLVQAGNGNNRDGGFEYWDDENTPTFWTINSSGGSTAHRDTDTRPGSDGDFSLRFDVSSTNGLISVVQNIADMPGADGAAQSVYRLRFWAKATANDVILKISNSGATELAVNPLLTLTTSWAQYELYISPDAVHTTIGITRNVATSESIWLDDIQLDLVGTNLITNNNFGADGTDWTISDTPPNSEITFPSDDCNLVSDGTAAFMSQNVMTLNKAYVGIIYVTDITSGGIKQGESGATQQEAPIVGANFAYFVPTSSTSYLISRFNAVGANDVTFTHVILMEVNETPGIIEGTVTKGLQGLRGGNHGEIIATNLVPDGDMENTGDWLLTESAPNQTVTFADGQATLYSDGTAGYVGIYDTVFLEENKRYLCVLDVESYASANSMVVRDPNGGGYDYLVFNTAGVHVFAFDVWEGASPGIYIRSQFDPFDGTVVINSIKIYEYEDVSALYSDGVTGKITIPNATFMEGADKLTLNFLTNHYSSGGGAAGRIIEKNADLFITIRSTTFVFVDYATVDISGNMSVLAAIEYAWENYGFLLRSTDQVMLGFKNGVYQGTTSAGTGARGSVAGNLYFVNRADGTRGLDGISDLWIILVGAYFGQGFHNWISNRVLNERDYL